MDIYKSVKHGGRNQADILSAIAAKRAGKKHSGIPHNGTDTADMKGAEPRVSEGSAEISEENNDGISSKASSSGFQSAHDSFSDAKQDAEGEEEVTSIASRHQMSAVSQEKTPTGENMVVSNDRTVQKSHISIDTVTMKLASASLRGGRALASGKASTRKHKKEADTAASASESRGSTSSSPELQGSALQDEGFDRRGRGGDEIPEASVLSLEENSARTFSQGIPFSEAASNNDTYTSSSSSAASKERNVVKRRTDSSETSSHESVATLKEAASPTNESVFEDDEAPADVCEAEWLVGEGFLLPAHLAGGLYPHQKRGIEWLWDLHLQEKGGILGDDMGLGKTRQIATYLAGIMPLGHATRALLVVPTTLLAQWHLEFASVGLGSCAEFSSSIPPARRSSFLSNFNREGGIMLTTYEMTKDIKGSPVNWDYLVLDEGHLVKNPSTQRFTVLKTLQFRHCILLTGTPIQNQLKELWALFDLCCEGLLGTYKEFKKVYETPIVKGNEKDATPSLKRKANDASKALRQKIEPYFLRRLKRDIFPSRLDADLHRREVKPGMPPPLPVKTDLVVWLQLTNRQRQVYECFLQSDLVRDTLNETKSPLAALTVLKKICDHPGLLTESSMEAIRDGLEDLDGAAAAAVSATLRKLFENPKVLTDPSASCKLKFLEKLVVQLVSEGHRVLVFSQTKQMLDKAEMVLNSHDIDFLRIDGDVRHDLRDRRVQQFQAGGGAPVFLLTSKVGGLGLTLHSADRVVVLDPSWNPSTDNQSVDRAYRIGQQRDVVVYRLISCATVEEKIYGKQIMKDGLVRSATSNQDSHLRYFNERDVSELLTVPPGGFERCLTLERLEEMHRDEMNVMESLQAHVEFLKKCHNVIGISHHDLLYTKEEEAGLLEMAGDDESASARPVGQYPGPPTSRKPLSQSSNHQLNRPGPPGILQMAKSGMPIAVPEDIAGSSLVYDLNRAQQNARCADETVAKLDVEIMRRRANLLKLKLGPEGSLKIQDKIILLEKERSDALVHAEEMRRRFQEMQLNNP